MDKNHSNLPYRVLAEGGSAQIIEKKSKFIATLAPVKSEEEAQAFIDSMKKKYWDASHNCHAYVIGETNRTTKCHDDGEPGGTAGKPMLEVLLGAEITNVAAVVTRYFGGTLLGTGGLVRAYTLAVQEGIKASAVEQMLYGSEIHVTTDYNGNGKIQYLLGQFGKKPEDIEYSDVVKIKLVIPSEAEEKLINEMMEATAGKAQIEVTDRYYFAE